MCEACGSGVLDPCLIARGRHRWAMCPRCAAALQTPGTPVWGTPVRDLPPPMSAHAGWWSYRFACDELGYTLFHTDTRTQRDRLHVRWNQWLGGLMRLQEAQGLLIYAATHDASGFLEAWDRAHAPVRIPGTLGAWLIPRIVHSSKQSLLTAAPSRATLEAAAGVPAPRTRRQSLAR